MISPDDHGLGKPAFKAYCLGQYPGGLEDRPALLGESREFRRAREVRRRGIVICQAKARGRCRFIERPEPRADAKILVFDLHGPIRLPGAGGCRADRRYTAVASSCRFRTARDVRNLRCYVFPDLIVRTTRSRPETVALRLREICGISPCQVLVCRDKCNARHAKSFYNDRLVNPSLRLFSFGRIQFNTEEQRAPTDRRY